MTSTSFPTSNPHIIFLRGPYSYTEEGIAAGVIRPGDLIKRDSTGKFVKHATAGGYGEKLFAVESALEGKTIADSYAIGDLVTARIANPGDIVYVYLHAGEHVLNGGQLSSNGDGGFQTLAGAEIPIGVAIEERDASDSSGVADQRVRMRVL